MQAWIVYLHMLGCMGRHHGVPYEQSNGSLHATLNCNSTQHHESHLKSPYSLDLFTVRGWGYQLHNNANYNRGFPIVYIQGQHQ